MRERDWRREQQVLAARGLAHTMCIGTGVLSTQMRGLSAAQGAWQPNAARQAPADEDMYTAVNMAPAFWVISVNNASRPAMLGVDFVVRANTADSPLIEVHLPPDANDHDEGGTDLAPCAVVESHDFYNPLLIPPPGCTGEAGKDFLDKATTFLGKCYECVSDARKDDLAGQVKSLPLVAADNAAMGPGTRSGGQQGSAQFRSGAQGTGKDG